ncbi:right-handed parallel beta-helix repeat-containing protein [Paenibacillus illinoisensis]|uniref:Right-handed parallel beta-helix repeat-containing protein n=1 Tax=Paenibacillus illinoisensis TaxID=59845 RepID=A0ABW8HN67_9BACL
MNSLRPMTNKKGWITIHRSKQAAEAAPVIIRLTDYGAQPDSEQDTQPAMTRAIQAASQISGPVVLDCAQGRYHFYPHEAIQAPYYISNTASEEENPDITKTIGLRLKGMDGLKLEGNDSLFIFHGKQTMLLLDGCTNVEICNLRTDYDRPTVTEMTIVEKGSSYFDASVHPDSCYEILNGQLAWVGAGWSFMNGPMQTYDPLRNTTWRMDNWLEQAKNVEEIEPRLLRFHFDFSPDVGLGHVLQNRDGLRDQVGVLITECSDVTFANVGLHFMHGLGVVGQFSRNLTFRRMNMTPRIETRRTVAGFADFLHLSSCGGKVVVEDSRFIGSHDDSINVHGTYLRIIERMGENSVKVRFMHPQTYGLPAFYPEDVIEFVRAGSLTTYAVNQVVGVQRLTAREFILTLAHGLSEDIGSQDVIENTTWTPEVEIVNNYFARVPTRGILVTTRRKVWIANNVFERMHMSAILVAADAKSWYESGRVEDVTITGNHFIECGSEEYPVISIAPENEEMDEGLPVHKQVIIQNNQFETSSSVMLLCAKSTSGLVFTSNEVVRVDGGDLLSCIEDFVHVTACTEADIQGNTVSNRAKT